MNKLMQRIDSSWLGKKSTVSESDKTLRTWVGILGIGLAPAVWFFARLFGHMSLLPSISQYYHSNAGDLFVGVLFFVGIFQISYRGHQRIDNLITWITGILAICIAIFPCAPLQNISEISTAEPMVKIGILQIPASVSNYIHLTVAIVFFVIISLYVLFFFTKKHKNRPPSTQKKRKNLIFIICGGGMLLIIILLVLLWIFKGTDFFQHSGRLFFPEFGLLLLFGIAWLIKANVIPAFIDPN